MSQISQQELARQLGVSPQQMHKVEKGVNRVSAGQLLIIAQLFQISIAKLFEGYDSAAARDSRLDVQTSQMILDLAHAFLKLEPKRQDALIRLARALATKG